MLVSVHTAGVTIIGFARKKIMFGSFPRGFIDAFKIMLTAFHADHCCTHKSDSGLVDNLISEQIKIYALIF